MKLAIFDIDGTLIDGASERMFWRYLLRRGFQGPRQVLAFLLFLVRYVPIGGIHAVRKNKAYLSGLSVDTVEALAREFVRESLVWALRAPVVRRLEEHLQRGDVVVLMSGTLECVARALADRLGVRHVCATICRQRNGIFLAQPPEMHPYHAAKLSLVRKVVAELAFDLRHVTAYADSAYDVCLLEAVGEPVAVRPDPVLARIAEERGWEILGEQQPVEQTQPS